MEWEEIYKNIIPIGKYQTLVSNGEESGLIIKLESDKHIVSIKFGVITAFRMLEEGIALDGMFSNEILKYKNDNFSNTVYKINNGEFGDFIGKISNDLYGYLGLNHYIIITMNYIIEVISKWEPCIETFKK